MLATVPAQPKRFNHAVAADLAAMVALVNHEITANLISRAIYSIGQR